MQDAKVLIGDGDRDFTDLLREYFEGDGLSVIEVNFGKELIETALAVLPDVILLEVMMPGVSGYETCRALKADERLRNIPVIILTARTSFQDKLNGFLAGAHKYITKPCDMEDIRDSINGSIGNNGTHRAITRDTSIS